MTLIWDDIEIAEVSDEQFNAIPSTGARGTDPKVLQIIDAVTNGGVWQMRFRDSSQIRGARIVLGRAASQRGFKLECRVVGNLLYCRRAAPPLTTATAQGNDAPKRRGRSRKETQQHIEDPLLAEDDETLNAEAMESD